MLSKDQYTFLLAFTGFQPRRDSKPRAEFYRLSAFKGWVEGSKTFQKQYVSFKRLPNAPKQVGGSSSIRSEVHEGLIDSTASVEDAARAMADLQFNRIQPTINVVDGDQADAGGVSVPFHEQYRIIDAVSPQSQRGKQPHLDSAAFYVQQANDMLGGGELSKTVLTALCTDLGIVPVPSSNKKCKEALRHVHVNIYDYLESKQSGESVKPIFHSYKAFRDYSIQHGKIFPKKHAKASKVLRFLMREIA